MPTEHGCGVCTPSLHLDGPRRGEHHFAVRFGHEMMLVSQNGHALSDVVEVEVPDRAWRLCAEPPDADAKDGAAVTFHLCPCGSGELCLYLDESGGFAVTATGWELPR